MKKHILAVIAVMTTLCLTGCGGNSNSKGETDISAAEESFVQSETASAAEEASETQEENAEDSVSDDDGYLFKNGLLAVKMGNKWGYIDETGKYVIEPQFDLAENFNKYGVAFVNNGYKAVDEDVEYGFITNIIEAGKCSLIDKNGKYVYEFEEQVYWFSEFNNGIAIICVETENGGKCGCIDTNANFVIEPKFDYIREFTYNGLAAAKVGDKYGYINKAGEYVIEPKFDEAYGFSEGGIAPAAISDKWGYIDTTGSFVIEPQFDSAYEFSKNGFSEMYLNGKYGCVDITGNIVIEPRFDWIDTESCFDNGLILVHIDGKEGLIDKNGNYIVNPQFDSIDEFYEGYAVVSFYDDGIQRNCGIIDTNGNLIIEPKYGIITGYFDKKGLMRCPDRLNGKTDYIDKNGNIVLEVKHLSSYGFADNGLAWAVITDDYGNYKWGYIDIEDNFIIEPKFEDAGSFASCGLAPAAEYDSNGRKKYGYIDISGNYVISPQFDEAKLFSENDIAIVMTDDKYNIIDKTGNRINNLVFDDFMYDWDFLNFYNNMYTRIVNDSKFGLISPTGEIVLEPKYDYIWEQSEYKYKSYLEYFEQDPTANSYVSSDGYIIIASKNNSGDILLGIANTEGKIICYPQFSDIICNGEEIEKYIPQKIEWYLE